MDADDYMKKLIDMAVENVRSGDGGPFSCVILDGFGNELGSGCNRVSRECDPTAHAEIVALRRACRELGSFTLPKDAIVYSSCEPCPMCRAALLWAGAKTILYIATRNDAEKAGFSDKFFYESWPDFKDVRTLHIPSPDGFLPFQEWISSTNKIHYDPSDTFTLTT